MWLLRLLLFIIAVTVVIGFVLYNSSQRVDLNFPWDNYYAVPLAFVCFAAFVIGMFVTFLYSVFYFIKVGGDIRERNREIKRLEMELSALRNRSLEDLDESELTEEKRDQEEQN
jgi:uncharacterized integral membrane protein